MPSIDQFSEEIMQLIAKDKLKEAINELKKLLDESPRLKKDVIIQSARYNEMMKSIHNGTINTEDASVEKNKIRFALMNMLQEMEEGSANNKEVKSEIERFLKEREGQQVNQATISGDHNINAQDVSGSSINIQIGGPLTTDSSDKDKSD